LAVSVTTLPPVLKSTLYKPFKEITMSKAARFSVNLLALIVLTLGISSIASAQATRTWVSGVGDDANPCSRTAPCKTFAGAISKTAAGGEISVLDPGGFGAVNITKSLTINGDGTLAGILASLTTGVTVNAPAGTDVVVLRNLSINGANNGTNGIRFIGQGKLYVENCSISGFNSAAPNGNGILVALTTSLGNLFVKDTSIQRCSNSGITISTSTGFVAGVFDNVSINGLPTGVVVGNNAFVSIRDSSISLSTNTGVNISGTGGATASIENCLLNNNPTSINVAVNAILNLSSSTLESNGTAIASATAPANLHSSGNNRFLGNTSDGAALTVTLQK
jgi:hypothetical protein